MQLSFFLYLFIWQQYLFFYSKLSSQLWHTFLGSCLVVCTVGFTTKNIQGLINGIAILSISLSHASLTSVIGEVV
jgi:hypothetical protein